MLIKAKTNFAGTITMSKGQEMEYSDETILQDLLEAGYIEEVEVKKEEARIEPEQLAEDVEPEAAKEEEGGEEIEGKRSRGKKRS